MRLYVASDIHSYFSCFIEALTKTGYFNDHGLKKLVLLGDLFDRGNEARQLNTFLMDRIDDENLILVKGNHESLFMKLCNQDEGQAYNSHLQNGTYQTALALSDMTLTEAMAAPHELSKRMRLTDYYRFLIPKMLDYYESQQFVFTHSTLPGTFDDETGSYHFETDWRHSSPESFEKARWPNPYVCVQDWNEDKPLIFGHYHTSYAHCFFRGIGTEYGPGACFEPYFDVKGKYIGIDACTAVSSKVNVLVLEDE